MNSGIFIFVIFSSILISSKVYANTAECSYDEGGSYGYSCTLEIHDKQDTSIFTEINGTHVNGKTDDDVFSVWVYRPVHSPNLPSVLCNKFKNLKSIFFQQLVLTELPENTFASCKNIFDIKIKSKKFSGARITKLPENLLAENTKLKVFEAEMLEIKFLPERLFANNPNLWRISLRENNIRTLPANIFKPLVNLKDLIISDNSLSHLKPSWFETLENLENLYLNDNQISDIPKNAFTSLKKLKELWISSNNIRVLHSDSFGQLPNLATINLVYNRINAIDERFIDNIGIKSFQFANMICAENQLVHESEDKTKLKEVLKTCFDNYEPRVESVTSADVEERVEVDESTTPDFSGSPFDSVDGQKMLQDFLALFGALTKQLEEASKNVADN